jgi:hypothetical protein
MATMPDTVPDPKTAVLPHEALEAAWLAWRPGAPAPRWQEFLPERKQPVSRDVQGVAEPARLVHATPAGPNVIT